MEKGKSYTISIRKGDNVRVMVGKDAGKSGRVLSVNPRKNTVIVEHANLIKRHTRPNPAKNIKGGIVEKEAGLNVSKVMIVCSSCGKHARIGHQRFAGWQQSARVQALRHHARQVRFWKE